MTRLHPRLEAPLLLEYYKMLRRAQIEEACTFSDREATVTIGGFITTEDISAPPYLKVFQNSKGDGVLKLLIPRIGNINNTQRLCLSYPGLTPHGACLEPSTGIIVASITGPDIWEMIIKGDGF